MNRADRLVLIMQLHDVVGWLERKWPRPQSADEAHIIQTVLDARDAIRKDHEAQYAEEERQAVMELRAKLGGAR